MTGSILHRLLYVLLNYTLPLLLCEDYPHLYIYYDSAANYRDANKLSHRGVFSTMQEVGQLIRGESALFLQHSAVIPVFCRLTDQWHIHRLSSRGASSEYGQL